MKSKTKTPPKKKKTTTQRSVVAIDLCPSNDFDSKWCFTIVYNKGVETYDNFDTPAQAWNVLKNCMEFNVENKNK